MSWLLDLRLRRTVRRGDAPAVAALLARGARAETRDTQGLTCLMVAANRGHIEVMDRLIEHGADVDAAGRVGGRWSGFTPLMAACCDCRGTTGPVERLLEAGADPRAVDSEGRNVRDYAELSGYPEIAALLEAQGVRGNLEVQKEAGG